MENKLLWQEKCYWIIKVRSSDKLFIVDLDADHLNRTAQLKTKVLFLQVWDWEHRAVSYIFY